MVVETGGSCDAAVVLICGLPGSGKSHLARSLKKMSNAIEIIHLEYDSVQDNVQQEMNVGSLEAWRLSRKSALDQLSEILEEQMNVTEDKDNVRPLCILMDDNFHLRSMRKQVYRVCQTFQARMGIIWIECPLDVCLSQNLQREKERIVAESIIRSMEIEKPDRNTSWEENVMIAEMLQPNAIETLNFVVSVVKDGIPIPPLVDPSVEQERINLERRATSSSSAHQIDLELRECVKRVAKMFPQRAKDANQLKKKLQKHLKAIQLQTGQGSINVPMVFCDQLLESGWCPSQVELVRESMRSI